MVKRTVRKLELHKESIRQLDPRELKEVAGGATKFCTFTSCGQICP